MPSHLPASSSLTKKKKKNFVEPKEGVHMSLSFLNVGPLFQTSTYLLDNVLPAIARDTETPTHTLLCCA